MTDTQTRNPADRALDDIDEQWRVAFESIPTMYFIVDASGSIARVNQFGAEQLGYTVDQLIGEPVLSVFYEPDRDVVQRHARECFAQQGRTKRWEARKVRRDGSMLWVRETANAVVLKEQSVLLIICEDITEQKRAEDAARRSERELRDVIECIPAMAFSALPDGSNAFVNRRWREYTGLSGADTAGTGWRAALHPDDVEHYGEAWVESVSSGQPFEREARFRRADGEHRWHLVRSVPMRDEHEHIFKWYGVATDIEDRKQAEALLAAEKRILEMVAKGSPLGDILDSLCRFVEERADDALASVLLVQGDRLRHGGAPSLPKTYTDTIDGIVIGPGVGSCGEAVYRGQQVIVADIATDPLWDQSRDVALAHSLRACWSTPIFSSRGEVIAAFALYYRKPRTPSARDEEIVGQTTHLAGVAIERKLIFERLQRNEAYLAEAERLTHTATWAWDPKAGRTRYWSAEMFRIHGEEPRQSAIVDAEYRERTHPDDVHALVERLRLAQKDHRGFSHEYRVVHRDGTVRHVHIAGEPVRDEQGRFVEFVGTMTDITERKRAELERERLQRLEADLAHAGRLTTMGELAASLAHEIRQPIAAAVMNANACVRWLERAEPSLDDAREAAHSIVKDVARAGEIIGRLRSMYTKAPPERALVDVNDVVREILVLVRSEAHRYAIATRTVLTPDLPLVTADRVQLQQVLMNLMLNAIEAMKDTGGELAVASRLEPNGDVEVLVADTGVGIPSKRRTRFSRRSTRRSHRAAAWDCRLRARSWSFTAAGCGQRPMWTAARRFISHCRPKGRPSHRSKTGSSALRLTRTGNSARRHARLSSGLRMRSTRSGTKEWWA